MKLIPLTRGQFAIVDDDDYQFLAVNKWTADPNKGTFYAIRRTKAKWGRKKQYMHRVLMDLGRGDRFVVDHINGNGLDNRRENLRVATYSQNCQNSRRLPRGEFKGVYRIASRDQWEARISFTNKDGARVKHKLGRFATAEEAARAFDAAALRFYGEFAVPNFRNGKAGE
jgi:hypothetical protein